VRYLIDTTFVIDYLRADPEAVARYARAFETGDDLLVNEIVVCEAATGALEHPDPDLMRMLGPLDFIQPGPDAAHLAGRWRAEARATGYSLSLADSLIASAALTANAIVLTRNAKDFELTPVRVETY
jgi:predicted nucleic acid-binding protein